MILDELNSPRSNESAYKTIGRGGCTAINMIKVIGPLHIEGEKKAGKLSQI
jgi:hypothetical protein